MLYNVIKSSPLSNNIALTNIEKRFHSFFKTFSFVDINTIEYCRIVVSDDGISFFTIKILNILSALIL